MEKSRELRDASINNFGASVSGANLKPLKSILKKPKSPSKEGIKVSMNPAVRVVDENGVQFATAIDNDVAVNGRAASVTNDTSAYVNEKLTNVFEKPASDNKLCDKGIDSGVANKSFASVMGAQPVRQVVTLSELRNDEVVEGAAVTLPLAAVDEVNARFANTLFGYFIGKRLAFKLVENYVTNTWAKFGLKRMQLHGDFFLFQFDTKAGMERVLETGPWMIRHVPLILNMWSPNVDLKKEEVKTAPVWIKLHHVPIVAYTEVGLSLITTQIGKPIMLDSYTSNMCASSWGRSSYARALIEVSADKELMDSMVIAIPMGKDKGHSLATVEIEYEWRPPRCSTCLIFDHVNAKCPKLPKEVIATGVVPDIVGADQNTQSSDVANDGFQVVKKKRNKKKEHKKQVDGVVLNKSPLQLYYRRVDRGDSSKHSGSNVTSTSNVGAKSTFTSAKSKVPLENSFSALDDKDDCERQHTKQALEVLNESDSEVDEVITFDDRGGSLKST